MKVSAVWPICITTYSTGHGAQIRQAAGAWNVINAFNKPMPTGVQNGRDPLARQVQRVQNCLREMCLQGYLARKKTTSPLT